MYGYLEWALWAVILIVQNFSFTYVSRARNSGSLMRHMKASVFSNGVWFFSQMIIFGKLYKYMTGEYGFPMAMFTALFYTVFTMGGSLFAHWHSMRSEKGKAAVGASKHYAQIPVQEWEEIKKKVYSEGD